MSLGYDREYKVYNLNDTANLLATLYDRFDDPYSADNLIAVEFKIQAPDGTITTKTGTIEDDGSATLNFDDTDQVGHYVCVASFTTSDEGKKSVRVDFETTDPFAEVSPSPSWYAAVDAWEKFEDCFDAEDEGPWLRDMTLNVFNKTKMEKFIDDALMDINLQNPPTDFILDTFVQPGPPVVLTSNLPLLTQGLVVQLIRHLIRSYVEQPNPVGAQIAWHDRRDYLQRWQSVLQIEQAQYMRLLALWKRQYLGLGTLKGLVSSKAGRLLPAPMRTRNVGRGYW